MFKGFNRKSWKDFLPSVYSWVQSVPVSFQKSDLAGAVTILPVAIKNGSGFTFNSAAAIGSLESEVESVCKTVAWQGQGGSVQLGVKDRQFGLVATTNLDVPTPQAARQFGIDLCQSFKGREPESLVIYTPKGMESLDVLEGIAQALYEPKSFKGTNGGVAGKNTPSVPNTKLPKSITFVSEQDESAGLEDRRSLCQSMSLVRMLQDAPANVLTPEVFGQVADDIAKERGLKCQLFDREGLEKEGMGSFLSVADGSELPPRMILVEIPGKDTSKTVSLVGKGLTFDAGGVSIKPAAGMEEMKYDMSGGAAVMGAIHYFSRVKPETNVFCLIGAVENMCSGKATRPGDIVVASNGKSIEVQNTDAEGRLVLADVLSYTVRNHKPQLIVNAATLTGACLHALGHCGAALMSNDDDTAEFVTKAARDVGEPLWRLPLWPELEKEMKGSYGDLANLPKPNVKAGTIIGGVFLKEFVEDTKWVHLDIAGTAWSCMATGYTPGGGSGFGMKTMIASVQRFGH